MEKYKNLSGDSPIVEFEIGTDSISIKFKDGWIYIFNGVRPGALQVEKLKSLAAAGKGLSGYLSSNVGKNFFSKRRF